MNLKRLIEEFDLNSIDNIDINTLTDPGIIGNLKSWAASANIRMIFLPDATTLQDLENAYTDFLQQPQKIRRIADWQSIYAYKATNKQIYDIAKSKLLKQDLEDSNIDELPLIESAVADTPDDEFSSIDYGVYEIEAAIDYSRMANRAIIYPTSTLEDLERLWDQFNLQIKKNRRESDWESVRLFNCTNLTHYAYLKSKFLKLDIKEPEVEVNSDSDTSILENSFVKDTTSFLRSYTKYLIREESITDALAVLREYQSMDIPTYDSSLIAGIVDDVMTDYDMIYKDVDTTPDACNDLPFYEPDELIDLGVTSHNLSEKYYKAMPIDDKDFPIDEFLSSYTLHFNGIRDPLFSENASKWTSKVRLLCLELAKLKISGSADQINEMKQTILEYGWNPEFEFDNIHRVIAQAKTSNAMAQRNESSTSFIDLRNEPSDTLGIFKEADIPNPLYPIYIVLVEGNSWYANAIMWWTNSKYSHASISFDPTLRKLYSFGANDKTGAKGGFIEEDLKNLPKDLHLAMYAIFVKKEDYDIIKQNVEYFAFLGNKTKYGYLNILTLLFNIPMNKSRQSICSQFVDSTLKLVDINLTNKDSSLVTPEDFHKVVMKKDMRNKKIYILFQGLHSSFRPDKIKRTVANLLTKVRPVRESTDSDYTYIPCIQTYREIKELPIRFNDDGDIIIDKPGLDFMNEYSKCHKLLIKASEAKNYEVMKYELANLWRMNEIIEMRLRRRKGDGKLLNDARAHILNDFNKYIKEVLEVDPKFNFTKYYEDTPYGSGSLKINKPTLKYATDMITRFMRSL